MELMCGGRSPLSSVQLAPACGLDPQHKERLKSTGRGRRAAAQQRAHARRGGGGGARGHPLCR